MSKPLAARVHVLEVCVCSLSWIGAGDKLLFCLLPLLLLVPPPPGCTSPASSSHTFTPSCCHPSPVQVAFSPAMLLESWLRQWPSLSCVLQLTTGAIYEKHESQHSAVVTTQWSQYSSLTTNIASCLDVCTRSQYTYIRICRTVPHSLPTRLAA